MSDTTKPNWDQIETDYRAGIKPLRQIAEEHHISHTAINKHAKRDGWVRDLSVKIKLRAEQLVSKAAVSKEVSKERLVTESQIVEANAVMQKDIILNHRKDIQRYRTLCSKLLDEIEITSDNRDLFNKLGELLDESGLDEKGKYKADKLNETYHKVISMTSRIGGMKQLAETLKILIGLERQAFGIADNAEGDTPKDDKPISAVDMARQIAFAMQIGIHQANNEPQGTPH